mmetsp:Transcript_4242/g.10977  ORF Transcript_4242/g.10977 Transcript_4242/m.10977 type:complete len:245 (+) Transcript_4242:347-1081(+)
MRRGHKRAIGPAFQHVADEDDELAAARGRGLDPLPIARLSRPTARLRHAARAKKQSRCSVVNEGEALIIGVRADACGVRAVRDRLRRVSEHAHRRAGVHAGVRRKEVWGQPKRVCKADVQRLRDDREATIEVVHARLELRELGTGPHVWPHHRVAVRPARRMLVPHVVCLDVRRHSFLVRRFKAGRRPAATKGRVLSNMVLSLDVVGHVAEEAATERVRRFDLRRGHHASGHMRDKEAWPLGRR